MKKYVSVFIIIIITLLILSCGPKLTPYGEWKVLVDETGIPVYSLISKTGDNSIISVGGGYISMNLMNTDFLMRYGNLNQHQMSGHK